MRHHLVAVPVAAWRVTVELTRGLEHPRGGLACPWGAVGRAGPRVILGMFRATSLGRFERWNSWDLLTRPLSLLSDVTDRMINPLAHPRTLGATILLAGFLMLGYLSLVALTRLGNADPAHA